MIDPELAKEPGYFLDERGRAADEAQGRRIVHKCLEFVASDVTAYAGPLVIHRARHC